MTIWFDLTNVPHVNFLLPLIKRYEGRCEMVFTIRDFAETKSLFEKRIGKPYTIIGGHQGGSKIRKVLGMIGRIFALNKQVPYFDVKISCGGDASSMVAKLRGKKSITFDDNEKAPNWRYAPFSDLAFWPKAVPTEALRKQWFKKNLYQYDGYKENFYLADYEPSASFVESLPFPVEADGRKHYVVVRPENIRANYVEGKVSIVPELLRELEAIGANILFLPRYETDKDYAQGIKGVYIPTEAVNGLDACYYADAILTGAGTMAREAACMGVPSVSFFAGSRLLAVDQSLVDARKMFFSRDVKAIIEFLKVAKHGKASLAQSHAVQEEIFRKVDEFVFERNLNKLCI